MSSEQNVVLCGTNYCRHKRCIQKLLEGNADIRLHDNEGLTAVSTC